MSNQATLECVSGEQLPGSDNGRTQSFYDESLYFIRTPQTEED
jgi:hypothetical protein